MDKHTELSPRERKLLLSFISPATMWFRLAGFAVALLLFVAFVQFCIHWMLRDVLVAYHGLILILLSLGFAAYLYRKGGKLTGGRAFRAQIRKDLDAGLAESEIHEVTEAIEVASKDNQPPAFFLKLSDQRVLYVQGRETLLWKFKGFPWKRFAIRTAPHSGRYLGLLALGDSMDQVTQRPPLNIHELVELPKESGCHFLEDDFESLKAPRK